MQQFVHADFFYSWMNNGNKQLFINDKDQKSLNNSLS